MMFSQLVPLPETKMATLQGFRLDAGMVVGSVIVIIGIIRPIGLISLIRPIRLIVGCRHHLHPIRHPHPIQREPDG